MTATGFMPNEETVAGIQRDVVAYEQERVKAHAMVQWRVPLFLGAVIVAIGILAWLMNGLADPYEQWFSTPHVILYFSGLVLLFWMWSVAMSPATELQKSFRERLLPVIFGFIGDVRYRHGGTPDTFARLPREVTGSFNRQRFDDVVSGRYEDFPFELYEVRLGQKSGKTESEIFKGVIIGFHMIQPFPGKLVAARKVNRVVGFFRGLFGNSLQELDSGVPSIDDAYEFRTDNLEAARPLVTGRLAQALEWMTEAWPEQPARVALSHDDGFLLIPLRKNFFELPGISVPLDYDTHVRPMVADMASLLATVSLVRKAGIAETPAGSAAAQP